MTVENFIWDSQNQSISWEYNGKTINPQNYIKELTKEQNNNGLGEMVNEINMMIK